MLIQGSSSLSTWFDHAPHLNLGNAGCDAGFTGPTPWGGRGRGAGRMLLAQGTVKSELNIKQKMSYNVHWMRRMLVSLVRIKD